LDETLLHFEELNDNEGQLSIRPGADSFLKLMSTHFEIVIFTAGTEEYADWALEFMENVSCITHRLYRQHALPFKGYYVKDLSRIGRQLTKTIIVDNIAENFALQPANGILIKTWISDPKDTSLFELAPLLLKVVESQTEDVRELLKFYQQQNAELMQSIAYGSKDQLNTLSNQMTIAQD
jgi:CTD small phosphatase-like protein 2